MTAGAIVWRWYGTPKVELTLGLVALVALAWVGSARASCPVTLDGDPDVAAQITAELAQFSDDSSPCVALRVACTVNDGGVTIDLRDELGGAAVRTFESAGGAAAFVISWSRRPMLARASALASVATAPIAPASERWPSQPWHGELALSAVYASGGRSTWGLASLSLIRKLAWFRAGLALRLLFSDGSPWSDDAELTVGAAEQLTRDTGVRIELVAARSLVKLVKQTEDDYRHDWGQAAIRAGARATFTWRLITAVTVELSGSYDAVRNELDYLGQAHLFGSGETRGFAHFDLGVRWVM